MLQSGRTVRLQLAAARPIAAVESDAEHWRLLLQHTKVLLLSGERSK